MKIVKAHNVFAVVRFAVVRGLLILAFGLLQVVAGLIGMNASGSSDGSAAQQFVGIFVTLFSAIGMLLIISGAITTLYSILIFGNIRRTRRGISRGFLVIDVIANIATVVIGIIVLFSDGEDANVYACIVLLVLAAIGFAFDITAFRALKAVRGGSYNMERNMSHYRSYKAFSVLGALFGIIPSIAFAAFALSVDNYYGESAYDIPIIYAALAAVCVSAVLAIIASVACGKGKGGLSGALLTVSAIGRNSVFVQLRIRRCLLHRACVACHSGNMRFRGKRKAQTRSGAQRKKIRARLHARSPRQINRKHI